MKFDSNTARAAALRRWAKADGRKGTQAARNAFLRRFEAEADPDGDLPAAERRKRAGRLLRAHMADLAAKRKPTASQPANVIRLTDVRSARNAGRAGDAS
jgi:hypothetical protein